MRDIFFQIFVVGCGLGLACSCSVLVDAERKQCSRDADCSTLDSGSVELVCEESFCRPPARWACLDEAGPAETPEGSFTLSFVVRDTVTQMPQVGLEARVCRRLEVDCAEKQKVAGMTDAEGLVQVAVAANFDGYVRFSGPEIASTLYFLDPPVAEDRAGITISTSSPQTIAGLGALTGATPDPSLGVVLVTAFDCLEDPVEGATIAAPGLGAQSKAFYVRNGLPSTTASATDETGYAGIVNAPTGTLSFSAELDGKAVGNVTLLVQPGAQSIARIVPHGG